MNAALSLCTLALRPLLRGACEALGLAAGEQAAEGVADFLAARFTDQSQRLPAALQRANDRAWRALEIALAGESLWSRLDRAEDRAFRAQVRALLEGVALPRMGDDFRRRCLVELHAARKAGLLTVAVFPLPEMARWTADFARFADPAALLDAEWQTLDQLADILSQAHYLTLARLLGHRSQKRAHAPLLAVAVRYFFRREVEDSPELFRGLALERLDQLSAAQEAGFAALADALASQALRLDEALRSLADVRSAVLDIKAEQERQGQQLKDLPRRVLDALAAHQLEQRPLRPSDSLSIRGDEELRLVKQLLKDYRALPEEQRRQAPALLYGLGKLQMVAGDFKAAQGDFQAVTRLVKDPGAQAEAHFSAYRAALERKCWDEALAELKQAMKADPARFAPFPPGDYEAERILGAGGFGVAFLCRHRHSQGRVVVKAMLTEHLDRDVATVFEEARALQELRHDAIIRLQHCSYVDADNKSRPYLVTDYFPGKTLQEYVECYRVTFAKGFWGWSVADLSRT